LNWLNKSKKLLQDACTPWGIKASLTNTTNYGAIFTRDAVIAGIVGVLLEDKVIIDGLKNTLLNLKKLQGNEGQIASNFKVENDEIATVSFGTLSPKIDSCTWYLLGVGFLIKQKLIDKAPYKKSIEKAIDLLNAWEYNGKHLLSVPKGGNWADEYVYDGYVLYDQLLRGWGLSFLGDVYAREDWIKKSSAIIETIGNRFPNEEKQHYNASFFPGGEFQQFDLAAHALAGIVLKTGDPFLKKSLNWISKKFIDQGIQPPAFYPTISEGDPEWNTLRNYHLYAFKNKPNHYHNGGIWWVWLGWLSVSLSLNNYGAAADKLNGITFDQLDKMAGFNFEEYLSSDLLEPNGTEQLCYTAAGIALMCLAKNNFDFSILKSTFA